MATQILDSPRRCCRCAKKMMMEIGQHADRGDVEIEHQCWSCGHTEYQDNWSRFHGTDGHSAADRLRRLRLGVEIPLKYSSEPFPEMEI